MVRWLMATWALFFVVACSQDEVFDARGELKIASRVVEFPRTFVGYPTQADLVVHNTGRATLVLALEPPAQFTVGKREWRIPAGDGHRIPIGFSPLTPGSHDSQLKTILPDGTVAMVDLVATAASPPSCVGEPCVDASFDPVAGVCIRERKPDRSPCISGNLCRQDEVCDAGECKGEPKNCGKGDKCTEYTCNTATGECEEIDLTPECPAPTQLCLQRSCHPVSGCGFKPREDYTRCGDFSCAAAELCKGGQCQKMVAPDDMPCNASCGSGLCKQGKCSRKEGPVLSLRSRYLVEEGKEIVFDGISDWAGAIYWVECGPERCELGSRTYEGFPRWKEPLPFSSVAPGGTLLSRADVKQSVLVAGETLPIVASYGLDGDSEWKVDLTASVKPASFSCPCAYANGALTAVGTGHVLFSVTVGQLDVLDAAAGTGQRTTLTLLDVETGEVVWSLDLKAPLIGERPIADEEGNLFLLLGPPEASVVRALSPDGATRWSRSLPGGGSVPVAVSDGVLALAGSRLLSTDDGSDLPLQDNMGTTQALPPLLGPRGYLFYSNPDRALWVQPWDPFTGVASPAVEVLPAQVGVPPPHFTAPLLSLGRGAILSMSQWTGADWFTELVEIKDDGSEARRCEVPWPEPFTGRASLRANTWVAPVGRTELRFYSMPETAGSVSSRGWVGPGGNAEGGGTPR